MYHLQASPDLSDSGWCTIESFYGTGEKWICPLFPGSAPQDETFVESQILPSLENQTQIRQASLIIEKTDSGEILASWTSLDDNDPRRMMLTGVTLDPIWNDFDSSYIYPHGGFFFSLSPRLGTTVAFSGPQPSLGPLDTAMIADFITALPDIAANISSSVTAAAQSSRFPQSSGNKAFYRVAADWGMDSDHDGRTDWEELVLDGNNPYAADTDGNGITDAPPQSGEGATGASGYPIPADAENLAPKANIEQLFTGAGWNKEFRPNQPDYNDIPYGYTYPGGGTVVFDDAQSFSEFQRIYEVMDLPEDVRGLMPVNYSNLKTTPLPDTYYFEIYRRSYTVFYKTARASFRLHLDAPAPAGGYRIPIRLARLVEEIDPDDLRPDTVTQVSYVDVELEALEGYNIGSFVDVPSSQPAENTTITYIPGLVEIFGNTGSGYSYADERHGLCVTPSGVIYLQFKPSIASLPRGTKIFWQARRLTGGGSLENWFYLKTPGNSPEISQGDYAAAQPPPPGIYQLQAVMEFTNGGKVEFPFVRLRNARSIRNSKDVENVLLKAGQLDYFGVVPNGEALAVREQAIRWLGSKTYKKTAWVITDPDWPFNPDTSNRSKCNLFVTHVANRAGARTPYFTRWAGFSISAPLAREDWFGEPEQNVDLDAPGWKFAGVPPAPAPGMTVASPGAGGDSLTSGHVGILDYDGSWINAGEKTVNKAVHLLDTSTSYKPNNMRTR